MKNVIKTFAAFFVTAALCGAQDIAISGVVRNNEGYPLEGAVVRLGKAGISTVTGRDGSFNLTAKLSAIKKSYGRLKPEGNKIFIKGNTIFLPEVYNTGLKVSVYDSKGRLLWGKTYKVSGNMRTLTLPDPPVDGISVYLISVNNKRYALKRLKIAGRLFSLASLETGALLSIRSEAGVEIDDALLAAKDGYQLSRIPVTNTDTSGVVITLIPFDTGTVEDIDGNLYKTVRYGDQIWTVENLRTTRYNDGNEILYVGGNEAWSVVDKPAYCFFGNTTDPEEQIK